MEKKISTLEYKEENREEKQGEYQVIELQHRNKSILFWIGLVAAVYQAVYGSLTAAAGLQFSPLALAVMGSISVAFSAVLMYCNGNNPSLPIY